MKISDWLDEKEAEGVDVSQITLPKNMSYDEDPDETLFFKAMFPLSVETAPEKWRAKTLVKFGDVAQENAATPDNSTDTLWLHHESAGARI